MCVVSMIMQYYHDKWQSAPYWINVPGTLSPPVVNPPTQAEIDEFRKLLDRAREYDKRNNEPDCENGDKKAALKALAEQWKIDISFTDKEVS